jgi:hypothetical protein
MIGSGLTIPVTYASVWIVKRDMLVRREVGCAGYVHLMKLKIGGMEGIRKMTRAYLEVENNWGSYEWTFNGGYLNPNIVHTVFMINPAHPIQEYDCRVVERETVANDMGVVSRQKTKDIEIKTEVLGSPVWVSLYNHPNIRRKVTGILNDAGKLHKG